MNSHVIRCEFLTMSSSRTRNVTSAEVLVSRPQMDDFHHWPRRVLRAEGAACGPREAVHLLVSDLVSLCLSSYKSNDVLAG